MFNLTSREKSKETPEFSDPGFEEVPHEEWMNVEINSFIKYQRQDGVIVRGGFVIEKRFADQSLILRSDKTDPNSKTWKTSIAAISKMWKKRNNEDMDILANIAKNLNDRIIAIESKNNNGDVFDTIPKLEELSVRVSKLESDFKKLHEYLILLDKFLTTNNS
jgi:hypothetical protein